MEVQGRIPPRLRLWSRRKGSATGAYLGLGRAGGTLLSLARSLRVGVRGCAAVRAYGGRRAVVGLSAFHACSSFFLFLFYSTSFYFVFPFRFCCSRRWYAVRVARSFGTERGGPHRWRSETTCAVALTQMCLIWERDVHGPGRTRHGRT
jgi:hypothetical protein